LVHREPSSVNVRRGPSYATCGLGLHQGGPLGRIRFGLLVAGGSHGR
jgi:hypothetical protein